jgi:hypothetical protein
MLGQRFAIHGWWDIMMVRKYLVSLILGHFNSLYGVL